MTRQQIIAAASQISSAIEKAGILQMANPKGEKLALQDFLKAFKDYNILAEKFSEGAVFLEKELKLYALREPDPWIEIANGETLEPGNPLLNANGVLATLSAFTNLLSDNVAGGEIAEDQEVLSLIMIEDGTPLKFTPRRVSEAIDGILSLYEACAGMQNHNINSISVVNCDSGNNMVFDFLGSKKVIISVKELILSIWERVIFYRDRALQEKISSITHSLPILENIAELEINNSITSDDAERIRKAIVKGVTNFLSSGSIISEIKMRSSLDFQQIRELSPPSMLTFEDQETRTPNSSPAIESEVKMPELDAGGDSGPTGEEAVVQAEPESDIEEDNWDGILEDDLRTLRELIDKTKRTDID